ncbi:GerAB/ArcD/ProY family transporter [Clostridium magnum]|uniref:Spore germination protein YndE n=1 Tax=Clostridium magnum DSM 2767 TaxID=1121326 RepID=A0A161WD82_9CLOT|nr:GerAB/ArcD/ProY family transporter [Clostridium magnum]KZL89665.1 spore germination protein YndE [Clostridium magnum DSM 2767]SHH75744.1 spore germination protein (amino acid permease) [Clostridium magnum DSM 2767]
MSKGGKFSVYEGVLFTTVIIVSKTLYTSPSIVVKLTGTASWYVTLISCVTAVILFSIICILLNRFPGKNLIEIYEGVLGNLVGKIVGFSFSAHLLYYAASVLREFLEMIKVYNLPHTPPSVIIITYLSVCTLINYKGIESMLRIATISFYPIIFGIFIILALALPYYHIDYIKPYLGYGFKKTLYVGFFRSSAYAEVLILPTIITSLYSVKDCKRIGVISILLSGFIFSVTSLCYLMTYQYTMGVENLSGIFELSRMIYYSRYAQRMESIFLFAWVIFSLLTVSSGFYLSIRIYCQNFHITDPRPLLLPFALLTYVVALQPKSISELIDVNLKFIRQQSFFAAYGVPIFVLIIALIFRKKDQNSST